MDIETVEFFSFGDAEAYGFIDDGEYNDCHYNGYTFRGLAARTEAYAKEMIFGEHGDLIASVVGGSSTTYWCDCYHCN